MYELVYSLCVMGVSSLTLCLIKRITYFINIRAKLGVVVHHTARCAQFITCRSVGSSPGMSWVVSLYVGMVPGYGETSVCMALASVEGTIVGGDNPIRP
jgi:hypothetical protein